MKLVKIFAAVVLSIVSSNTIQAKEDKSVYINASSSLNKGTGVSEYSLMKTNFLHLINSSSDISNIPNINLGKGLKAGIGMGYKFNKNMALELGVDYHFDNTFQTKYEYSNGDVSNSSIKSKMIQIKPTIVMNAGFNKIDPYIKMGLIIGKGIAYYNHSENVNEVILKMDLFGGSNLGYTSSFGANFKSKSKVSFYGELNLISLTFSPKQLQIIQLDENGVDQLPLMTTSEKEFNLVNMFDSNKVQDDNKPSELPLAPFSMNSVGITFGIQYKF